jgi:hypothetical protein
MRVDISVGGVRNVGLDLGGKVDKIHLAQTIRNGCGVSSALPEGNREELEPVHSPFSSATIMNVGTHSSTPPYVFNGFISIWNILITT